MTRKTVLKTTVPIGCLLALAAAPAAHAAEPDPAPVASEAPTDEVVVTARKTKEKAQDVPIAITAIGRDDLARNNHIRLEELNQISPSTVVTVTNGHQTTLSIRGLGANPGSDGLENSAGIFVDGVYLGRPGMVSMDLIDIQQIEELRGPQGTLFGKNTTAGLLNITTALPDFNWGAKLAGTYGNYNYQQFQGSLTGPLTDTLAFRLTGYSTTRGGDVYDVSNGQWVNNLNRNGARLQFLWKPSSDLSVRLIGEYASEQQSTGAILGIAKMTTSSAKLQAATAATGGTIITNPYVGEIAKGIVIDPTGKFTAAGGPYDTGTRQGAGSVEVNWNFSGFTLSSITAFRYWQYRSNSDEEGGSADVAYGGYFIQDRQWTQEVRLAFPHMGPFDLTAGLFYFNQYVQTDLHATYQSDFAAWYGSSAVGTALSTATLQADAANPASALYATAKSLLASNNSTTNTYANPLTHSIAGFAQGTWHAAPNWNVTAGIRVTNETKKASVYSVTTNVANPHISDTAPSWLITTDYHPTRSLMVYGTISHGEKAGGLNTTQTLSAAFTLDKYAVAPETATNYEVGMKGDWFHHRLTANFDLFRTDVHNFQSLVEESVLVNGAPQTITPIVSAGRVRTQGAEFEATVIPVAGISLHGYAAYNDAKYLSYTNGPCPIGTASTITSCDLSGKPVDFAPKWTAGINGNAETALDDHLTLYFSPELSYRSHFYAYNDDSPDVVTGGYALVNLRAGVRANDGRWDLSVWGRNVTDHHYVTNYFNYGALLPGAYAAVFGDPVTYGVTLRLSL